MKKIKELWNKPSLIIKIIIGLVLGVLLGILFPGLDVISALGTIFVGALKAIAPILVSLLVVSSIAGAGEGIGSRFVKVILLYLISTMVAAIVAVLTSRIFPITLELGVAADTTATAPQSLPEIFESLLLSIVENPIEAMALGNYMGVLFWAIVVGIAIKKVGDKNIQNIFNGLANIVSHIVATIVSLAPFGIMGIAFTTVSQAGIEIFVSYGKVILLLCGTMAFIAIVTNSCIVAVCLRRNPFPLVLKCLKDSGIPAFFTRSSAANIPVNMELCRSMGLDPDFYSVSIPLGSTVNMNGAAVTITVMSLAMANTLGITVPLPMAILLSIIATLGACGTSGVAGGSLLLIPMACALIGIPSDTAMQAVGVGFIISVVQDSVETALNSSSDVLFTATAELMDRRKKEK